MRGVIHHLDLTVRDPERSFAFYDAVLSALGYRLERKSERGFDWNLDSPVGVHSIGIVRASETGAARAHDRYAPGLHHVAWGLESRSAVDGMYEVARKIGARVLDAPADYPHTTTAMDITPSSSPIRMGSSWNACTLRAPVRRMHR